MDQKDPEPRINEWVPSQGVPAGSQPLEKAGWGGCQKGANTNRIKVERNADDRAVTRSARARRWSSVYKAETDNILTLCTFTQCWHFSLQSDWFPYKSNSFEYCPDEECIIFAKAISPTSWLSSPTYMIKC